MLRLAYVCTPWPESEGYGCTGGSTKNIWKNLNATMSVSQKAECEMLCKEQKEDGCCFLKDRTGCYWRKNALAHKKLPNLGYSDLTTGLSITCMNGG